MHNIKLCQYVLVKLRATGPCPGYFAGSLRSSILRARISAVARRGPMSFELLLAKCPNCKVGLVMSDRQGVEIDYCPKCRGGLARSRRAR